MMMEGGEEAITEEAANSRVFQQRNAFEKRRVLISPGIPLPRFPGSSEYKWFPTSTTVITTQKFNTYFKKYNNNPWQKSNKC